MFATSCIVAIRSSLPGRQRRTSMPGGDLGADPHCVCGTADLRRKAGVHEQMTSKTRYASLEGRTVLVTGGASGIGAAIVRGFVRNGARVALIDLDRAAGEALAVELGADAAFHRLRSDRYRARCAPRSAQAEAAFGPDPRAGQQRRQRPAPRARGRSRRTIGTRPRRSISGSSSSSPRPSLPGMKRLGGGTIVNLVVDRLAFGAPPSWCRTPPPRPRSSA